MENAEALPQWHIVARILCLSFGALIAGGAALFILSDWLSAPRWATTQGEVVQSSLGRRETRIQQPSRQGGGEQRQITWSADIVYHYRVRGRDYTGFGIGDGVDWNYPVQASAIAALRRYSGTVTVYYDPANPERSALDPSLMSWIPLAIGGIGLLLLGAGYALWRREPAPAAADGAEEAGGYKGWLD